jgi:hypothetical protein
MRILFLLAMTLGRCFGCLKENTHVEGPYSKLLSVFEAKRDGLLSQFFPTK